MMALRFRSKYRFFAEVQIFMALELNVMPNEKLSFFQAAPPRVVSVALRSKPQSPAYRRTHGIEVQIPILRRECERKHCG